jgi:Peptidase A4 family
MRFGGKRQFRPHLESVEDRCLLSQAVVEVTNKSTYTITFNFRWTTSSSWSTYTESPGQGRTFWVNYSNSLTPQVEYDTTSSSSSQTIVNLSQGYGEWDASGDPPASSATQYGFQNTTTGVQLYYLSAPTPTVAVVEITNESAYTVTFDFRWTSSSSWSAYTEAPGQGEIFWVNYSESLTPQALYDTTTSSSSQLTVSLAQGYGEWTGTGTPPTSAAKQYEFQNTSSGVELYYGAAAPAPTLGPAPNAQQDTNWAGYVVEAAPNSVTDVSGTWNVPAVSGPAGATLNSSTWVGIDGDGNQTVEQLGTEQDVINGVPYYQAWWEMFSAGLKQPEQPIRSMTIFPGDSISATVQYVTSGQHAGQFLLSIVDNSRFNDSFSTYQTSAGTQNPLATRSSAEWIHEAPTSSSSGSILQMPNFSTVNFKNATATINGVTGPIDSSQWQGIAINLVTNGVQIATTSVLNSSASSFSISYNGGVSAQSNVRSDVLTSQVQAGTNDPQVIVVGHQTSPGIPLLLVVSGQPANVAVGRTFGLTVDVEDSSGNLVTNYNGLVTLVPDGNASSGSLGGNVTVNAVNGVATFAGLSLNAEGNYTIEVRSLGLESASFGISAVAAQSPVYVPPVYYVPPLYVPPVPPHLVSFGSIGSRRGVTAINLGFDEHLNRTSAENIGLYALDLGVKKRKTLVFKKPVKIRSIQYSDANETVTISLRKPTKGVIQLLMRAGILGTNGAATRSNTTIQVK